MIFPNMVVVPAGLTPGYQIRVPMDDTTTLHVLYSGRPCAADGSDRDEVKIERRQAAYDARGLMFGSTAMEHDEMAWSEQGPISDRTREHPGASDAGVLLYRNLLLENVKRVERGEDPMGVIREPSANQPFISL